MHVLVTGAHGFIGSHLCREFLARGWQVRALVSPWGQLDRLQALLQHPQLQIVRADIRDANSLRGCCQGVSHVVHAAAKVADWGDAEAFEAVNVGGTKNLLRQAEAAGVVRMVLLSSIAVHAYRGFRHADTRRLPRDGYLNAYARSKIAAEDCLLAADLEPVIVRPGLWPFGEGDPNLARIIAALQSGWLPLLNGGRTVLNSAYVGNLCLGVALCVTEARAAGQSYLIADDGMPSWRELLTQLSQYLDCPPPRLSLPSAGLWPLATLSETLWQRYSEREPPLTRYRLSVMHRDVHFSQQAAREELGYRPRYSWQQGLERSCLAWQQQPWR